MLGVLSQLPWQTKAVFAVLVLALVSIAIAYTAKTYTFGAVRFLMPWVLGTGIGIYIVGALSPTSEFTAISFIQPLWLFLTIMIAGVVFGSAANIWLGEALGEAPNQGLVWAIVGLNSPLTYIILAALAVILPQYFVANSFSWINFGGVVLLGVGLVMALWPTANS